MKKKHFVLNKNIKAVPGEGNGGIGGIPAGNCFGVHGIKIPAWTNWGDIAKTRRGVTCKNCRRTRVFRKLK